MELQQNPSEKMLVDNLLRLFAAIKRNNVMTCVWADFRAEEVPCTGLVCVCGGAV